MPPDSAALDAHDRRAGKQMRDVIGFGLRAVYASTVAEPIPDAWARLLREADRRTGPTREDHRGH